MYLNCFEEHIKVNAKKVRFRKMEKPFIETIRGLLMSKTSKLCKFIDRDLNAAKNILKCYRMFPRRPPGFSRSDENQVVPEPHFIVPPTPKKRTSSGKPVRDGSSCDLT
jgi:hypothetical protein